MLKSSNNSLFLISGTGVLGIEIAKGLITASEYDKMVALVPTSASQRSNENLRSFGWKVETIDFENVEAVTSSMRGAKVVVSTADGIDVQATELNAVKAAQAVGASIYVLAQSGISYHQIQGETNSLSTRELILAHAKDVKLAALSITVGASMNSFPHSRSRHVSLTAIEKKFNLTFAKRSDVGFILAKVLAEPKYASGGCLHMQASSTTCLAESLLYNL